MVSRPRAGHAGWRLNPCPFEASPGGMLIFVKRAPVLTVRAAVVAKRLGDPAEVPWTLIRAARGGFDQNAPMRSGQPFAARSPVARPCVGGHEVAGAIQTHP